MSSESRVFLVLRLTRLKCMSKSLWLSASRPRLMQERVLIQQYLGLDGTHNDGMTFHELAVILNYNRHSTAEKAYRRAVEAFYAGSYGEHTRAKQTVVSAKRKL